MGRRIPQEFRDRVSARIETTMRPFVKGDQHHIAIAAADLEVSYTAVWFWYNGLCLPNLYNLVRFANYYEVSLDYLLGRTGVRQLQLRKVA